jgi:hypothetical protein
MFSQLLKRVRFIERKLLPKEKPLGDYTMKEIYLINCYVFLIHAEIESYIEDFARSKIKVAWENWEKKRKPSICIEAVLSFLPVNNESFEKKERDNKHSLELRINKSVTRYYKVLSDNNGIKRQNLLDILLPLGVEIKQLDETWLNVMDEFGQKRGEIAHNSIVKTQIDLKTEKNKINTQILPELKKLTELIQRLR